MRDAGLEIVKALDVGEAAEQQGVGPDCETHDGVVTALRFDLDRVPHGSLFVGLITLAAPLVIIALQALQDIAALGTPLGIVTTGAGDVGHHNLRSRLCREQSNKRPRADLAPPAAL